MTFPMDDFVRHLETLVTLPLCLLAALLIHEVGHYVVARMQGLKVESVTFGRGRLLWSRTSGDGTEWRLRLWPLGAHVHIENFTNDRFSFGKKLSVILAGPAANFLLPFILFFVFFASFGQPSIPNIVTAVDIDMPSYKAGLRPGDRILSINGEKVRSMDEIEEFTRAVPPRALQIGFERGGVAFETSVMPIRVRYRDIDGVARDHGRIGLSTWQQAYALDVVKSVGGLSTLSEDAARAALLGHMDERVSIGLFSRDGKTSVSEVYLSAKSNPHLADSNHREYDRIYLGTLRDNVYLPLSAADSARASVSASTQMLGNILRLPFNLLPIDKEWITPGAVVSGETSYLRIKLYVFVFFASLCSCFLGFLNLLPFPRLDGGEALLLIGEHWVQRPLINREKAAVLVFGLLLLYAAVFGANMNHLPGYYHFQMQKAAAADKTID